MLHRQNIINSLQLAFECSVYAAPNEPGLTRNEIYEYGARMGFQQGEISDTLETIKVVVSGGQRLILEPSLRVFWGIFGVQGLEQLVELSVFDFVCSQLKELARAVGAGQAKLERAIIVQRAVDRGINRPDVEGAISILVTAGHFEERDGLLQFVGSRHQNPLPSEQAQAAGMGQNRNKPNELRSHALSLVRDIVERRSDGRRGSPEPLRAFARALEELGYKQFSMWWVQLAGELQRSSEQNCPIAVTVLSAALVEGVLTFTVKHARSLALGPFGSTDFDEDPRRWKLEDLIKSASRGGTASILDAPTKHRAESLVALRQRIHAGKLLSEYPGGLPDLRTEEGRDSRATAELVVRSVLDWLERYPSRTQ